ncbi:MAG: efflux RND transporter periplasmic adaptor subunit [Telluria sp.]
MSSQHGGHDKVAASAQGAFGHFGHHGGSALPPAADAASIAIAPELINSLGIRTALAQQRSLPRNISSIGTVDFDEANTHRLYVRSGGWLEKLSIRSEGETVRKGQVLAEFLSPEYLKSQDAYLAALIAGNVEQAALERNALRQFGVSEAVLDALQSTRQPAPRLVLRAPGDGVVVRLSGRAGQQVAPMSEVVTLSDLRSLSVLADVPESQADWIREGQAAQVLPNDNPGHAIAGRVDFVFPGLDPVTRTLRFRVTVDNAQGRLKLNQLARVRVQTAPGSKTLVVPRDAVIRTGEGDRVILALDGGRFAPRSVRVGREQESWAEIIDGLVPGARVVASGQFLLDAESNVRGVFASMGNDVAVTPVVNAAADAVEPPAPPTNRHAGHQHHQH